MRSRRFRIGGLSAAIVVVLSLPLLVGAPAAGARPVARERAGLVEIVSRSAPAPRAARSAAPDGSAGGGASSRRPAATTLVRVRPGMTLRARPDASARSVGTMPSVSRYYHVPIVAWVERVSSNGRWGLVDVPYAWPRRQGWLLIAGRPRATTRVAVDVDLSDHRIVVTRSDRRLFSAPVATGAPSSPTPPGRYFVTDRVPFAASSSFGSFAFGISGIQPHLPPGWSGGNQLAVHGTNDPGSIGRSVSAGCVRVGAGTLHRLLPLLRLGTPVVIHP